MEFVSILYFFGITISLGYTLKRILNLKEFRDSVEKIIFLAGLGLSFFVLISIPLSLAGALYWYLFLILALLIPAYDIFLKIKKKKKFFLNLPKKELKIYIILGLIVLIFFAVYLKGAFSYSYLEDDDSWRHAEAAKYVSINHTYIQPNHLPMLTLEPYPPFYSALMGVLHQVYSKSIQWVLKFFNVLLISLGLLFAYIWLRKFTASTKISLVAVFLLAILPCFMSHFIWAQTLSLILWFPALYSIEKIKEERSKKWVWVAVLTIASVLITQAFSAVVFGIFFFSYFCIELIVRLIKSKARFNVFKNEPIKSLFIAGFLGLIIALSIYWVPEIIFRGWENSNQFLGFGENNNIFIGGTTIDSSKGTVYGFKDFIIAPTITKIDQPTGLGPVIFGLLIFSIIIVFYQIKKIPIEKSKYLIISLIWLVITIFGVEGDAFPYKLFPHRFWVFFAIPAAIITALGIVFIYNFAKKKKLICYSFLLAIFIGIIITSGYPKYLVEASLKWPPGSGWSSNEQLIGYINLKRLPSNVSVYSLCQNPKTVIGIDKMDYPWIKEVEDYKNYAFNDILDNNYKFLKKYDYSYLIVDTGCVHQFGFEQTNKKIKQIDSSKYFEFVPQLSNDKFVLFKILK